MTLNYYDLEIEVDYKVSDATWFEPEDWDTKEITVNYEYEADDEEVQFLILGKIIGRDIYEISDREEEILLEYINNHWDDLCDEFYDYLLDFFKDNAIEEAQKHSLSYYED